MKKIMLIFGNGYVSTFLSRSLQDAEWIVYCTSRQTEHRKFNTSDNINIINFFDHKLFDIIKSADAILSTVPTNNQFIDPVLEKYLEKISQDTFEWVGYLSSTGVYGNHDGRWVNESTKCNPTNLRSKARLSAENEWLSLYKKYNLPIHVFRLSGIYGPKRNCLEEIKNGKNFTVIKKEQFFSRIHVEDICQAIIASLHLPTPGEIYNLSDDEPCPIEVVQQFGASILNKKKLKEIPLEEACLSEQAKTFFYDNKKVNNDKITQKLNIKWKYPNYRVGLLYGCLPYLDD